jgi:hypothetical protein
VDKRKISDLAGNLTQVPQLCSPAQSLSNGAVCSSFVRGTEYLIPAGISGTFRMPVRDIATTV